MISTIPDDLQDEKCVYFSYSDFMDEFNLWNWAQRILTLPITPLELSSSYSNIDHCSIRTALIVS